MTTPVGLNSRAPIIVLDVLGYNNTYRRPDGESFFPASRYEVRLVTDIEKLHQARGAELTSVVGVPISDKEAVTAAALFHHSAWATKASAIVALSESLLLPAAQLRERVGLPGQSLAQTLQFRDKIIMKDLLRKRGVRVPDFAAFEPKVAHALLARHQTVVVKPRLGLSSVDVTILRSKYDLTRFIGANKDRLHEFDIEEFIDGTQYHIDSIVRKGAVIAATAGQSVDPTTSYKSLQPYRDVGLAAGAVLNALLEFNRKVVSCFPLFSGVTHHEVFLRDGEVVFCEIAARAGGQGVVPGFQSRTGINLHQIVAETQLGGEPPAQVTIDDHLTGYVLIYAASPTLHQTLNSLDSPWLIESRVYDRRATSTSPPKRWADAAAMVSVRGSSESEVLERLDEIVRRTKS
jgi:biotin carboxylase